MRAAKIAGAFFGAVLLVVGGALAHNAKPETIPPADVDRIATALEELRKSQVQGFQGLGERVGKIEGYIQAEHDAKMEAALNGRR